MNTKQSVATVAMVAVALMAAALTPTLASAQGQMTGKFTLPCTTYWNGTALPAGDYSFVIKRASLHADIVEVRGAGEVRHFALKANPNYVGKSSLTLARSNGVAVARELSLREIGRSILIPAGKQSKEMTANLRSSEIEILTIAVRADE
jgi:hypothetical protein